MADPLDNTAENLREANQETRFLIDAVTSLSEKIKQAFEEIIDGMEGSTDGLDRVLKQYERDFVSASKKIVTSLDQQFAIQEKINKGQNTAKDIEKERQRIATQKQVIDTRLAALAQIQPDLAEKLRTEYALQLELAEANLDLMQQANDSRIAERGIIGALSENAEKYLNKLDESGLAASLLSGNLSLAEKAALAAEAALLGIVNGGMKASELINNFQQNLGVSYKTAIGMQTEMALMAVNSEKVFITSEKLNKSFQELSAQTGLVADFGGETLVTMTTLTDRLGMASNEAGNLALLARTQGKNTEDVLSNTVATVSALSKQNGVAINAKSILDEISKTTAAITVSLGMNPVLLAEAATEARLLGSNLSQVDLIAASLLDFESSISNELSAELLTGKQINLEKARLAALNNDLATVSKEIGQNEEVINVFATGNRIQQEAIAASMGMTREDMAKMVQQQQFLALSAEQFKSQYGEVAYEQMQALSAGDKFQASLEKVQGILADIGIIIAPIIDGFAWLVGALASMPGLLKVVSGALTGLAVKGLISAISSIYTSFDFIPFGLGIPLAIGAVAGLMAAISTGTSKVQSVEDGFADEGGPFQITNAYGKTAVTKAGDKVAVSPNMEYGGNNSEMLSVLKAIANKSTNFSIGTQQLGTGMNMYTYSL